MHFTTAFRLATVLLVPLVVSAAPLKRTVDPGTLQVLQFAFVLESLETEFYSQALSKFQSSDFLSAGFSSAEVATEQITTISIDESTHVTAIQSILASVGGTPPQGCKFDFSSSLTSVSEMITVARTVEHVGIGAYLGAAHLVGDQGILTAAATIVTIESRHATLLNIFDEATAISEPFEMALLPNEVLAIAGPFISGCDLGIPANPSLTVTNTETVTVGTSLTFSSPALNSSTSGFHCQMLTSSLPFSISLPLDQCVVPDGINGVVAIWITSDDQPLNGEAIDRESNAIVAGPLLTFIDIKIDVISSLVRNKGGNNNNQSGSSSYGSGSYNPGMASSFASTTTVSPSDASALIASLPMSTMPPTASGTSMSMPSMTSSAAPNNGAIAEGISMVPVPTTTSSS